MTITITHSDGTSESYTDCTGFSDDGVFIAFTGKLGGTGDPKAWKIHWRHVRKMSTETTGD